MGKTIRKCSGVVILQYMPEFQEDGVVLIKTRNFRDSQTGDYLWTIVGGRIESHDEGESEEAVAEASIKRETWEEVRLRLVDLHYLGKETKTGRQMQYKDPETNFILYNFVARGIGKLDALEILLANDELIYAGVCRINEIEELAPIDNTLRSLILRSYDRYAFKK